MKKTALILFLPTFAAAAPCTVPGLPNIAGLDYHTARAKLINAGFFPALTPFPADRAPWETEPRTLYGYHETTSCAGTGYAGCTYAWKTGDGKKFSIYARDQTGPLPQDRYLSCK